MRSIRSQRFLSATAFLMAMVIAMPSLLAKHHTPTPTPTVSGTTDADMASGSSIPGTTPTPTPASKSSSTKSGKNLPTYQVEPGPYFLADDVKAAKVKIATYDELKKDKDGSYHIKFGKPASATPIDQVYYEVRRSWCESLTGLDMELFKGITIDQMQIRTPIGDVEVASPSDPTKFRPATDSTIIEDGSIIKTGDASSTGVMFGGIASARLIPNSMAVIGLKLTGKELVISIDLKSGGTFSKMAWVKDFGVSYSVKTSQGSVLGLTGIAGGKPVNVEGLDFALYTAPDRSDLYVLKGPVQINDATGAKVGSLTPKEHGVIVGKHIPAIADPAASLASTGESLGALLSAVPVMNVNSKPLVEKLATGKSLSPKEEKYLARISKVGVYERLDRVLTMATPSPTPTPIPSMPPMPPMASPTPDNSSPTPVPTPSDVPSPTPMPNTTVTIPMLSPTPSAAPSDVPTPPSAVTPSLPPSLPMTPPNPMLPPGSDPNSPAMPTPSPAPSNP